MIAGRYTYRQLPALKETALVDPERERVRVFRPGRDPADGERGAGDADRGDPPGITYIRGTTTT